MFDPILAYWIVVFSSITSYGIYIILTEDEQASSFYVYGKSLAVTKKKGLFWRYFLVPKTYFSHFYILSVSIFIPSLVIAILYYAPSKPGAQIHEAIDSLMKLSKDLVKIKVAQDLNQVVSLVFTLILMVVQCSRRLYECLFISVYSNNSRINLLHYVFGHSFYIFAALSTLCPIVFSKTSESFSVNDLFDNLLNKERALLFVLFVYTSHHQQKCHKILANLRKDKTGNVITEQHYVPSGGLFEYVSCPHFLLETILYFIIILMQKFSIFYWNVIFLLVLSTQTINAITNHRWYKMKYKDYPKVRRAIFPRLL